MDLDQAVTAAFASGHLAGILPSSVSETKVIKALIAASEEKIAQIDSQIRDLQCMRGRESGRLAWLKLGISPIRKLPDEMLTNIIRHARTTVQSSFWLSQVCKHWMELTHRIPALWTRQLPLRLLTVADPSPEHIAFIKAYVQRSNPLPLWFKSLGSSSSKTISPAVAEALLVGASRWEYLYVDHDHPSLLGALAKLRSEPLKMLESVDLRGGNKAQMSVSAFLRAPLLRKVALWVAHTEKFPSYLFPLLNQFPLIVKCVVFIGCAIAPNFLASMSVSLKLEIDLSSFNINDNSFLISVTMGYVRFEAFLVSISAA
ncbi:hypothetical protein R3P38DRAFT_2595440 [Favolaschia claudopus]|uniref:F-box domain-containing protein n=1 Tax=Favolaschia claudopus TaxID=2862362 RepID=A0AAW0EK13_9AGAR